MTLPTWAELSFFIPMPVAIYFLWRTVGKPPLPRWKVIVLCAAVSVSSALSRAFAPTQQTRGFF